MPIKQRPLPPVSQLRELFVYDPATGFLTNRISRTTRRAGARAESKTSSGHLQVYACGALRMAHRVAWAIHHGEEPAGFIDHIDGDPANNRIENLRECSHEENMRNSKPQRRGAGTKGVHRRADNGMWRAYVRSNGKLRDFGTHGSFAEAKNAADSARAILHGEFARS